MSKAKPVFSAKISRDIWRFHYQYRDGTETIDHAIQDSWRRVASTAAAAEKRDTDAWEERFYSILNDFQFLPAGRILAGAGSKLPVTLFNCFVLPLLDVSKEAIAEALGKPG